MHEEKSSTDPNPADTVVENLPLSKRIKNQLLQRILAGHYQAGERLVEMRIAKEFNVSQAPVREAFRDLEATGLIINQPRRGTYVTQMWAQGFKEIYLVRGALEESATRVATKVLNGDTSKLQNEIELMCEAARAQDLLALAEHSGRFHKTIMEASGNHLLLRIWLSLEIDTQTLIALNTSGLDLMNVATSHQPIVDAMKAKDVELACKLAREHQHYFEMLPLPKDIS